MNPNGILIGDGATVNVGNLYLSTKNLTDAQLADYTTATSALSAAGIADGDVINLGTLKADSVTVEGKNITFRNVADVNNGNAANVTLTANSGGEIHIGSKTGGASGYNTNGHAEIDYQLVSTAEELQAIHNNTDIKISGNFMLNKDIDMRGVDNFTPIASGIVGQNRGTLENAYNTGSITAVKVAGGVVGENKLNCTVKNVYNTGTVTGTGTNTNDKYVGGIIGVNSGTLTNGYSKSGVARGQEAHDTVGYGSGGAAIADADLMKQESYGGFVFSENGAWRIYEGQTMPLLTAFLTRKDNITSQMAYNGGANVGATYTATTYGGEEAQNGFNYIKDVSIVTPKDLTVSFGNISKIYDGTTEATAGTATLDGIVNSDAVSLAEGVTATYADKNVGTGKTVNYSGIALTGDKAKNYNLVNAATATGTGTITAKDITATVADTSKVYDGTTNATANGNLTGVIAGDTLTVTATGNYDNKNVGTGKTVNYTGFTLTAGGDNGDAEESKEKKKQQ